MRIMQTNEVFFLEQLLVKLYAGTVCQGGESSGSSFHCMNNKIKHTDAWRTRGHQPGIYWFPKINNVMCLSLVQYTLRRPVSMYEVPKSSNLLLSSSFR